MTHNRFDVTVLRPEQEVAEDLQALFDAGNAHEAIVFERWVGLKRDVVDLGDLDADKALHIAATLDAITRGRGVILGGRLPDDVAGHRTGKPDVLIRERDGAGYHPGDVKNHKVLGLGRSGLSARLVDPALANAMEPDAGVRWHEGDLLQLAHYWRMLQACGHAAAEPWGAIVGSDVVDDGRFAWYDLTAPAWRTFSRSDAKGTAVRSTLERYDHEHGFRVKVAQTALQRTGVPSDPAPLVDPVGQEECWTCAWAPVCVDTLPDDDLTGRLFGKLSVREYLALRAQGITTVDALAAADTDVILASGYEAETRDQTRRVKRLLQAQVAARLAREGVLVRPKSGIEVDLPVAPVEIDLDMENDTANRVYLWGALRTAGDEQTYYAFADPHTDGAAAEAKILTDCLDWIGQQQGAVVYYWSHVEPSAVRRILGEDLARYVGTPADPARWVDLLPEAKRALDSFHGHSLKVIAPAVAGFEWRDETPGGLASQDWLEAYRAGDEQAWRRILEYNEDDVRATLMVRRYLRSLSTSSDADEFGDPDPDPDPDSGPDRYPDV